MGFTPIPVSLDGDEDDSGESTDDNDGFTPVAFSFDDFDFDAGTTEAEAGEKFRIVLHPKSDLYKKGNEALLLLREFGELGQARTQCTYDDLPMIDLLDPERFYLT